jgi:hypothetical protein
VTLRCRLRNPVQCMYVCGSKGRVQEGGIMDKARSVVLITWHSLPVAWDWMCNRVCTTKTSTPSKHIFSHAIARTHTYFIILPGISQHVFYFCCKINLMTEDANVGLFFGLLARMGESCFILILRHCPKTSHKYLKYGPHVMTAAGAIWLLLKKKILIPSLS